MQLSPLFLPSMSSSIFASPSVQSTTDRAGAEEMDGESIYRMREGGQTKSKLERERVGWEAEERCEEKINLHSTSGQRQLK